MARPVKYTAEDKPVSVSIRIPRDLYDQAQHHAQMRRTSLTELLVEGLRMRLETPTDPRDIIASQSDTVMQELQQMIDMRIQTILAAQRSSLPEPVFPQPMPALSHDENITVTQKRRRRAKSTPTNTQNSNAVIQQSASQPQEKRKSGRPSTKRLPILALLRDHPEGLTAEQIRAYLNSPYPIGDTLAGMRRSGVVRMEGTGHAMRYFPTEPAPV